MNLQYLMIALQSCQSLGVPLPINFCHSVTMHVNVIKLNAAEGTAAWELAIARNITLRYAHGGICIVSCENLEICIASKFAVNFTLNFATEFAQNQRSKLVFMCCTDVCRSSNFARLCTKSSS